ncbi:ATP-dependent nuclease [Luteibacter sp.]|uniref:ATP-dependent nuclease n=1 Tax=Luteibacter sp. TaxID=1886636 RepID=UPI003F80C2CA
MKYRESETDKRLRAKFGSLEHAYLRRVILSEGSFRGLTELDIEFDYPITAISGKNGSGKSSILALACCAFHNHERGFRLPRRSTPYYTFKDFYIRHKDDPKQRDVTIEYHIAYNEWSPSPGLPDGKGIAFQERRKKADGKWNDYAARVHRDVVYFGIERVVPHFERSQSRSYSSSFSDVPMKGWESEVARLVGKIIGKPYTKFRYVHHARYSLPVVECDGVVYSGFHMGAGENALFEILSTIYESGPSSLIVIDEIELGLHAQAQIRLVEVLKELCKKMHVQIICTTHSRDVLASLPPDARFLVESLNGKTRLTRAVSPEFAFSKMAHKNSREVDIFVEDDVAGALLCACLPNSLRTRVTTTVIGSASAISRQLAAAYVRNDDRYCMAIFDGDQRVLAPTNLAHARQMAESPGKDFDNWIVQRFSYLPGDRWPEVWIMEKARECLPQMAIAFGATEAEMAAVIGHALQAGKHSELFEAAEHLGLPRSECLHRFANVIATELPNEFTALRERVITALDG